MHFSLKDILILSGGMHSRNILLINSFKRLSRFSRQTEKTNVGSYFSLKERLT